MRQEILECLDLGAILPDEVLTQKILEFIEMEEDLATFKEEIEISFNKKHMIPNLPVQDTFWSITNLPLKHKDLSKLRMLVLSDIKISELSTIQFSILESVNMSFEDQAIRLLYQGCFFPLDGRKPRKPRFLCLDGASSTSVILQDSDEFELGIQVCEKLSSNTEMNELKQHFKVTTSFRQCSVCEISGDPTLFHDCEECGAVIYCREKCKIDDWEDSHVEWCLQFKQFMTQETFLADLPFVFASVTTRRDFDENKRKEFLKNLGVHGQGLWHMELFNNGISIDDSMKHQYLHIDYNFLFGLEDDSSLLESAPQPPKEPLKGWKDYYSLRGFSKNSIIAVLLHFPLTLYYIITNLFPKDFEESFASIQQSKAICVHIIGAEKEINLFFPFLECARLLSPLSVNLYLFGNNFDDSYHCFKQKEENLNFQIHKGLYHKTDHKLMPIPDLAVCFNGGIGAYTSYLKTVKTLTRNRTPFYYTDYDQACIKFSSDALSNMKAGCISKPYINPFRSPFRVVLTDQHLPRYSNAFITHIKPYV